MSQIGDVVRTKKKSPLKAFGERYSYEIYLLRRNPVTVIGFFIVTVVVFCAIFAPIIAPYNPLALNPKDRTSPPSQHNILGTDEYGRDIFSRILYAARVDLFIAFTSVAISAVVGVFLGATSGYLGGIVDEVVMRILDIIQAFPALILAMALAVALGAGKTTIIYVVAFIMVPVFARIMRSEILSARERGYTEAALCMGESDLEIIFKQLLPNCLSPILVQFALNISYAILDAAALSFIGLGVRPPEAEWGSMVNAGVKYISSGQYWLSIFPGLAMAITILGFNLIADGLRDVFDPKMRS
jgi:peptide/nickel transport system permease protein